MREIKFRAWLPAIKKMTYTHTLEELMNWNTTVESNGTAIWMQYTGLKDKGGVEVYEGDICKYWMDGVWKIGYIVWCRGGFALRVFKMGERDTDEMFPFQHFIPVPRTGNVMQDQFEIIGNIHDNPELLGGAE